MVPENFHFQPLLMQLVQGPCVETTALNQQSLVPSNVLREEAVLARIAVSGG